MIVPLALVLSLWTVVWNFSVLSVGAALLLIALVSLGRRSSNPVNPYFLFATTPLALLLYSSSVSTYFLPPLELQTQLIVLAGASAYVLGLILVSGARTSNEDPPERSYSFWLILTLGLIPHGLGIATAGIPLLAADIEVARQGYVLPVVGQLMMFLPLAMLVAFRQRNRRRIVITAVLNFGLGFMVLAKFNLLFAGLAFLFGYQQYGGSSLFRLKVWHLMVAGTLAVPMIFAANFAIREGAAQTDFNWRGEVLFQSALLDRFGDFTYLPYLYLTTPLSNFAYVTEVSTDRSYGARSTHSVVSILQLDGLLDVEERPIRALPFNTHTYLSDFYIDFGAAGAVLMSFFLGLLVKWVYVNARRRPDVINEGIWICVGFASFMLFFSNHFTGHTYPLLALVMFRGYRFVSRSLGARVR